MKIRSLHIADFNQFQNFSLDLTYPAGHAKAGEPLDKVCIIGQSGTGKTSLLNLITSYLIKFKLNEKTKEVSLHQKAYDNKKLADYDTGPSIVGLTYARHDLMKHKQFFGAFMESALNLKTIADESEIMLFDKDINLQFLNNKPLSSHFPKSYYFSSYISFSEIQKQEDIFHLYNNIGQYIFDLSDSSSAFWRSLGIKIQSYEEQTIKKRLEFSEIENSNELESKRNEYQVWLSNNKNPLIELGEEFLDRLLYSFNVRVKKEVEFSKKEDIGKIRFETLQGKEVDLGLLSTGTKQIINSVIPLFNDKPKDAIILFDEPERSLYPDIQTKVVDFYTSLAPDSQFFFATHSPLIASGFDPWEVVELKFNEGGTVYQEQYFAGERHVDNYTIFPKRLSFDSILTEVFDLDEEINPERISKLMELSLLEQKIKETPLPSEKKALWEKYEKLAETLNWELTNAEN